jgi:hypothetical protein
MNTMLTETDVLAAATKVLESGGYHQIKRFPPEQSVPASVRFFEDLYGVVEVVVYETWTQLASSWTDAQALLVELMSKFITRAEAKSWEGYLVLMTPSPVPPAEVDDADRIRYDTSRVRKIVATGSELRTLSDIERSLLPLLPIGAANPATARPDRILDLLPTALEAKGVPRGAADAILSAFVRHEPLLEQLHQRTVGRNEA